LRFGERRLPIADFAVALRRRPRSLAGAAAFTPVVGILAEDIFLAGVPVL
jgi:hypothetical protein